MQARGRLIGLGVGPGDPELITLKALRLLRESPVVAYFVAKGKKGNAFGIIEEHLVPEQTLMPLVYPVTTEALPAPLSYEQVISDFYDAASVDVAAHLDAGEVDAEFVVEAVAQQWNQLINEATAVLLVVDERDEGRPDLE